MTAPAATVVIPTWTLADRMRKAREITGLDQTEMAAEIGVSRTSVGNYESGRTTPRMIVLKAWSLRSGVPVEWIATGAVPGNAGTPDPDGDGGAGCAIRDLNPEPAGSVFRLLTAHSEVPIEWLNADVA